MQLADVVDRSQLFGDYIYHSSSMPALPKHFQEYVRDLLARYVARDDDFVVEIGSNDGLLLEHVRAYGRRALGVDPARNLAAIARRRGVETLAEHFSTGVADQIRASFGAAKAIIANNVVAHIDDLHDFAEGVQRLLSTDGVVAIEAPYLGDMLESNSYDTIYHEHVSFLALSPLQRLVEAHGLEVFDVTFHPVQGRSFRALIGHTDAHPRTSRIDSVLDAEDQQGFADPRTYERLAIRVRESREALRATLLAVRSAGGRVAGYGAPAKGNTLLNYCGLGPFLEFVVDDLPSKQGLLTPGTHLRVLPSAELADRGVDHALLLAWNYAEVVLTKERRYRERGGRFILPAPTIRVV